MNSQVTEDIDQQTKLISDALKLLTVATGHYKLYGPEHATTVYSIDKFTTSVGELCNTVGPVVLTTSLEGIRWKGAKLTNESEERKGLGYHLFREGISSISFLPGIRSDEVKRFIELMGINLSSEKYEEETLESLLWQAEFQHIGFQAISAIMEAEAASGIEVQRLEQQKHGVEGSDENVDEVIRKALDISVADSDGGSSSAVIDEELLRRTIEDGQVRLQGELEEERFDDERWFETLFEAESSDAELLEGMKKSLAEEDHACRLSKMERLLLDQVNQKPIPIPETELMQLVWKGAEALSASGSLDVLLETAEKCAALSESHKKTDPQTAHFANLLRDKLLSPQSLASSMLAIDLDDSHQFQAFENAIDKLPEEKLLELLGILESKSSRDDGKADEIFRRIAPRIQGKLSMFLYVHERLEPDCLVAVIKLSRMCGNRDLRAFIKDLLKTDDERITVELVKWLGDGLDRQDIPILARMLFTRSRAVRKELLSVLEKHRPAEMAHLLRDGILDPRFEKQPASVKEGLCIALGKIERDRAVEFFSDILGKAGLFGKYRKKSATVQAAAMGLAACNTDDAVRVLKKYARGLNAERASACRHALEKRNEL